MSEEGRKFYPPAVIAVSAAVPPVAAPADVAPATPSALARDVRCIQCGYNLRGLDAAGVCPECGTPVGASLGEDRLAHANPAWLRRLRGGMALYAGTLLVFTFYIVLWSVLSFAATPEVYRSGYAVRRVLQLLTVFLMFLSAWLLTAPEPGRAEPAGQLTLRSGLRTWAAVCAVVRLAYFLSPHMPTLWLDRTYRFASDGIYVVYLALTFTFLRRLAGRVPKPGLALWLWRGMWGAIGGYVLYSPLPTVAVVWLHATGRATSALLFIGGLGELAFIVCMIAKCIFILTLRRSIRVEQPA